MKTKTINIILCRLFDRWVTSIEDPEVRELVHHNTLITGGCITSMLLGEPVNDYDMYFRNKETAFRVAKYYVEKFKENPPPRFQNTAPVEIYAEAQEDRVKVYIKSAGVVGEGNTKTYRYFEQTPINVTGLEASDYIEGVMDVLTAEQETDKPPFRPIFMSSNAITLSDQVQLIVRFFGKPEEVHENFDFVHCTNYWDSKIRSLVLNKEALATTITRELRYMGSKYPLCSIIRTRKFIQRQWTVNAGQYLKMVMQLQKLDLTDINVLEDQLTGVDAAYFLEVIAKLRDKDPEKVNSAYLIELIDRIF
jgi:hypothetical protein